MKFKLYQGDCLERLSQIGHVNCIFADPPDNIGLGYDQYDDKKKDAEYEELMFQWISAFIKHADITWLSFNAKWTATVGWIARELSRHVDNFDVKPCVQVFTFGQHNKHDLGNNHRPLWRFTRKDAKLYPEAIKVPSWRQRNGDKRAAAGGRVPGDVFDMQYPSPPANKIGSWLSAALDDPSVCEAMKADIRDWFETCPGDVLDFPRVTGNSAQRCDWHPTQLHEELVERCIKLSTGPKDSVLDPFGGTGTTLRVCMKLKQPCSIIELDEGYCQNIAKLNGLKTLRSPGTWGK